MTIKEIAKLAGVSISTVSKIVNSKDENINPETRKRVLKIVKEYNYTPYGTAKQISGAKNFVIGVLLQSAPKTNQLLNGIMERAGLSGYSIIVCDSHLSGDRELKNITSLCRHKVDGVIWEPVAADSAGYARHFSEHGIPFCIINRTEGFEACDTYQIDFMDMGYSATLALIDRHHLRPGCLLKDGSARSAAVFEGFKKCLFDHQITFTDAMRLSCNSESWYPEIVNHELSGIVSSHYDLSLQLVEQLSRLRCRLPYELSLVTLRDDVREALRYPGISSFRIPYQEFGAFVCRQLLAKCENCQDLSADFELPCKLENTLTLDIPFSSRAKKIVIVGSINIDVTLNVDELPQPGTTIITGKHTVIPGGKGANQAVGAAKLGADVSLIGKVGNDYYASMIYTAMEEYQVDTSGITRESGSGTGKAYIHVRGDGESAITILQGANQLLTPQDIRTADRLFENAGYCLLQTEIPADAVLEAAKTARSCGAKTILKPAALKAVDRSLMQYINIFVPNEWEAATLAPGIRDIEKQSGYFREMGANVVIITLGQRGCYLDSASGSQYFPAPTMTAVDTTGAADAFISALAVYLLRGNTIERSVKAASCAAGFCISRQGVIPALADRNSLESYLERGRNTKD